MDQAHHYELALLHTDKGCRLIKRRTIGDMQYIQQEIILPKETARLTLKLSMEPEEYTFSAEAHFSETTAETIYDLKAAKTRYLSSETAGGFTGVMLGLYAVNTGDSFAEFSDFIYTPMQN